MLARRTASPRSACQTEKQECGPADDVAAPLHRMRSKVLEEDRVEEDRLESERLRRDGDGEAGRARRSSVNPYLPGGR